MFLVAFCISLVRYSTFNKYKANYTLNELCQIAISSIFASWLQETHWDILVNVSRDFSFYL